MIDIVILAGGKGTRMKSDLPKVLTEISGKPIIHYLLEAIVAAGVYNKIIIVISPDQGELIKESLKNYDCQFVIQEKQAGTGDAVAAVLNSELELEKDVMVSVGDHPLLSADSIKKLAEIHQVSDSPLSMMVAKLPHYEGFYNNFFRDGRIKRDAAGKYYLTDLVAIAVEQGVDINSADIKPEESVGINTQAELARVKELMKNEP